VAKEERDKEMTAIIEKRLLRDLNARAEELAEVH
jgi:hypothetical protein